MLIPYRYRLFALTFNSVSRGPIQEQYSGKREPRRCCLQWCQDVLCKWAVQYLTHAHPCCKCISQAAAVCFHTSLTIYLTVYGTNSCHFEGATKCWGKCLKIKQQRNKLHHQEFYTLITADNNVRVNQLTRTLWSEKVAQYLSQRFHQVSLCSVMLKSTYTRASQDTPRIMERS